MQALYTAVRSNDPAQMAAVVAAEPTLEIFAAAITGDVAALEALLSGNRSLISAVSPDGWYALHLASHFAKEEAARLLLNKGAQVNARSTNALNNTALHAAAAGRAAGVAKLLLERGGDANARQHSGWCPLHAAAQNGDVDLAKVLIEGGADVNVRADNQQRPIDLALSKGQQAMVDLLESNGATL